VDRAVAEPVKSVSAAVAEQMARGVCALFGSELGLATTGYAEASVGVTQPFAWWALVHELGGGRREVRSGRIDCPGLTRVQVQEKVAETVVGELVKFLQGLRV
jgi:nicotinamide-nucleotide amidase